MENLTHLSCVELAQIAEAAKEHNALSVERNALLRGILVELRVKNRMDNLRAERFESVADRRREEAEAVGTLRARRA